MIYEYSEYPYFISNLKIVAMKLNYSQKEYNKLIGFIESLEEHKARYLIDVLNDFFAAGVEMG